MGKLYFRYGAMNSGKSTALLQAAYNYEERGQRVLLAKPHIDTKGESLIVSRLGVQRLADFTVGPEQDFYEAFHRERERVLRDSGLPVSCLLIDEAQFLTEGQVDCDSRRRSGSRLRHPHRLSNSRIPWQPSASRDRALA
jgi:thymidine kinase